MKPLFTTLAALTVGLLLTATVSAQTTKTYSGVFHSTDGNNGTYVRTTTVNGATLSSTIVYTRESDKATATDTYTRTTDGEGNRTVNIDDKDFGATAAYVAQKTVTKEKHGQFVGKGTYTTATGDSGTLSTLESAGGFVNVLSNIHTSPTTGVTQMLDLRDREFGFTAVKHITLAPNGTVTTVVTTRYITGGGQEADED